MKKTFFYTIFFLATIIFSCSSNEENIIEDTNSLDAEASKTQSKLIAFNDILSFKSFEHFDATVEDLYTQIEAYDDKFLEKYGHLTEDEIDDIEDKIVYDEFAPVTAYEKSKNFTSLRSVIAKKETLWLTRQEGNERLDFTNDPDNHVIIDDVERALLNQYAEVKIGGIYYKYYDWGLVSTKNYVNLVQSRTQKIEASNSKNLSSLGFTLEDSYDDAKRASSCKTYITRSNYYHNGHRSRRAIKVKHKVRRKKRFKPSRIVTIIKGYKRRRGKWRRRRTPIGIHFYGNVYLDCNSSENISRRKSVRRRRSRRARLALNPNEGNLGVKNQQIRVKATQYSWSITKDLYDNSN